MKRKNKSILLTVLIGIIVIVIGGCQKTKIFREDDLFTEKYKTGIYKVIIDINQIEGEEKAMFSCFFTPTTDNISIYDKEGRKLGNVYIGSKEIKKGHNTFVYYTNKEANSLIATFVIATEKGISLSYSLKGYYNDKLIKEISGKNNPNELLEQIGFGVELYLK